MYPPSKPIKFKTEEENVKKLIEAFLIAFQGEITSVAHFFSINTVVLTKIKETGVLGNNEAKIRKKLNLKEDILFDLYLSGDCSLYQLIYQSDIHQEIYQKLNNYLFLEYFDTLDGSSKLELLGKILQKTPLKIAESDPYHNYPKICFNSIYQNRDLAVLAIDRLKALSSSTILNLGNGIYSFLSRGCERMILEEVFCQPSEKMIDIIWDWEVFYSFAKNLNRIVRWKDDSRATRAFGDTPKDAPLRTSQVSQGIPEDAPLPIIEPKINYTEDIDLLFTDLVPEYLSPVAQKIRTCFIERKLNQSNITQKLSVLNLDLEDWREQRLSFINVPNNAEARIDATRAICDELLSPIYSREEWLNFADSNINKKKDSLSSIAAIAEIG